MRRRIIMALLAVGAIGGFASGFHHLRACRGGEQWRDRAATEQRSDCTDHHGSAADGDDR